jgi:hypothetical protein
MLHYGEGRLIGTAKWNNLLRTYDQVRTGYLLWAVRLFDRIAG